MKRDQTYITLSLKLPDIRVERESGQLIYILFKLRNVQPDSVSAQMLGNLGMRVMRLTHAHKL